MIMIQECLLPFPHHYALVEFCLYSLWTRCRLYLVTFHGWKTLTRSVLLQS